jgi:hypothetical protein
MQQHQWVLVEAPLKRMMMQMLGLVRQVRGEGPASSMSPFTYFCLVAIDMEDSYDAWHLKLNALFWRDSS